VKDHAAYKAERAKPIQQMFMLVYALLAGRQRRRAFRFRLAPRIRGVHWQPEVAR
jgi:hypothetical protein